MVSWKKISSLFLLLSVLVLSACSAAPQPVIPTAAPTQDLGVVRTQSAETVVAQITADALANPSATPTSAPTETQVPPTEAPTQTPTVAATSTPISTVTKAPSGSSGGSSSGGSSGGTSSFPTITPGYPNHATFVSQTPYDGTTMKPGWDFDAKWTFKNSGTRSWNDHFYIKYVSGDLKPKKDIYMLDETVDIGGSHTFVADFTAPSQPGRYDSNWVLYDDNGAIIYHMYVVINVQS